MAMQRCWDCQGEVSDVFTHKCRSHEPVNEALSPRVIEQGSDRELQEYVECLHQLLRYATHRQQERVQLVSGTFRQAQRHADLAAMMLSIMPTWLQAEIGWQQ